MRATDFGTFNFATTPGYYAGDIDDPNDLESRLIAIPGADGAYDARRSIQSPKQARVVRVDFGIEPSATLTIDQQLDLLLKEIHKGQQLLKVKMSDNSTRQAYAKCIRLPRPHGHGSKHFLELAADFELQDPYWYDTSQTIEDFPGIGSSPYNFNTSSVPGTAPIKKILVEFIGGITNPRLTNNTNDLWVQWTGVLGAGHIYLDTGAMNALNGANDVYGAITMAATQIGFMRLELGVNAMTLTGSSISGAEVKLTYRATYH